MFYFQRIRLTPIYLSSKSYFHYSNPIFLTLSNFMTYYNIYYIYVDFVSMFHIFWQLFDLQTTIPSTTIIIFRCSVYYPPLCFYLLYIRLSGFTVVYICSSRDEVTRGVLYIINYSAHTFMKENHIGVVLSNWCKITALLRTYAKYLLTL